MKIKPIADKVIVKPIVQKQKEKSGLLIPESSKTKSIAGHVIAVGPGRKDEPMQVKVGDKVIYGEYSGKKIIIDQEEYLVMQESDIDVIL